MGKRAGAAEILQSALDEFRRGDLDQAGKLARDAARKEPKAWGAAYVLGLVASARGESGRARSHFEDALRLNPASAETSLALGDVLRQAGSLPESSKCYCAAAELAPDNPLPHFNLGLIAEAEGRLEAAGSHYARAIGLKPDFPEAWNNQGNMLRAAGDFSQAKACYVRASELRPRFAEAWDNLGVLHEVDLRDYRKALEYYERAAEANPDFAQAHFHLGVLAYKDGHAEKAVLHYEKTLQLRPDHAEAYNNLGMIFYSSGFLTEAQACFERALAYAPDLTEAHNNLGILFARLERFDEAEAHYRSALEGNPGLSEAHYGLGLILAYKGETDGAISAFRRAWELHDDYGEAAAQLGKAYQSAGDLDQARAWLHTAAEQTGWDIPKLHAALLLPPIMESVEGILESRRGIEAALDSLLGQNLVISEEEALQLPDTNFFLAYHGMNDCGIQGKLAATYIRACPSLAYTAPHTVQARSDGGRIRIGFVSRFLYHHSVGNFFGPVIEHLAMQPEFEVSLFPIGRKEDAVFASIAASCAEVVRLEANSFDAARKAIAERQLDILVYPEIGMDPFAYLLAFSRLATTQCVLQGHSVTSGIPNVDYFVSSALIEPPGGQEQYSEKLALLETLPMHLTPPDLPERAFSREELGLAADKTAYVCPMKLQKVHPEMDWAIGEILRRDPQAEVVFVADDRNTSWHELLAQRFARSMGDLAKRVRFIPWMGDKDRFIGLLQAADVVLDSFHHGGATTSHLCLSSGVPMVTWVSQTSRSRFILAYYQLMGVFDCIAETPQQYVEIALRVANDKAWRGKLAARIGQAVPRIYDNDGVLAEYKKLFLDLAAQPGRQPRAVKAPYVPVIGLRKWCERSKASYIVTQPPAALTVREPEIVGGEAALPRSVRVMSPEGYLAELEDVEVIGGHGVIMADQGRTALLDLELYSHDRILIPDWLVYHHLAGHLLLRATHVAQVPIVEGIWLGGKSSDNYYHWLVEFLPRLKTVEQFSEYRHLPLVIDAGLHPNLIEALRRFAPDRDLVQIEPRRRYRFRRLIVPSNLNFLPHDFREGTVARPEDILICPPAVDYLRSRLAGPGGQGNTGRRRLYVVRRNPKYRRLLNEAEVEGCFLANGFERVCPDELSLAEQIEVFSQAEVIAGPTGAAMANMIFAPRDATVIILYYSGVPYYYFSSLGSCIGQRVIYVFGEPVPGSHGLEYQRDFSVPPDLIDEALSRIGRSERTLPDREKNACLTFGHDRFRIHGDKDLFFAIVDDMRKHAGSLAPNAHWHLLNAGSNASGSRDVDSLEVADPAIYEQIGEDAYEQKYGTMERMMDPWLGSQDMQPVSEKSWRRYGPFLRGIDSLELLPGQLAPEDLARAGWITADLGSVMDLNLMACFSKSLRGALNGPGKERLFFIEVGGGYGRLAEAVLKSLPGKATYLLLDAVPASLLYCYLYLKKACPDKRIGFWNRGDPFDLDKYDAYVMPAWHFDAHGGLMFDVSVNIESMQEMSQHHVDHYGSLFDAVTRPGGLIYISNARDYVFRGAWPCADTWQRVYLANTPRSWSPDHPTEIFVKRESSEKVNTLQNRVLDATYKRTLG